MGTYLVLQRASDYGSAAMALSGSRGAKGQRDALKLLGGRVIAQYALLGPYDVALIVEFPDELTALAVSLRAQEDGFYTEMMPAFTPQQLNGVRERLSVLERKPRKSLGTKPKRKTAKSGS